jgi:hypothetical protein
MNLHKYLRAAGIAAFAAVIPAGSAAAIASPAVAGTAFRPPAAHLVRVWHNSVKSSNWSGYAVAGATFTDVIGTWKQPAAKCSGSGQQYASFWVGIDGYSSTSVEQLGTDSDCNGSSPSYYGWYEMYPANSVNLGSKYKVSPGDTITAEVKRSGTSYVLSMKDVTAGWTFSINKTSSTAKNSSAEWVIESPEICGTSCSLAKLADFGKITFSKSEAATTGGDEPISKFTAGSGPHKITMTGTPKTVIRSVPGKLTTNGEGFTTTWKHS